MRISAKTRFVYVRSNVAAARKLSIKVVCSSIAIVARLALKFGRKRFHTLTHNLSAKFTLQTEIATRLSTKFSDSARVVQLKI